MTFPHSLKNMTFPITLRLTWNSSDSHDVVLTRSRLDDLQLSEHEFLRSVVNVNDDVDASPGGPISIDVSKVVDRVCLDAANLLDHYFRTGSVVDLRVLFEDRLSGWRRAYAVADLLNLRSMITDVERALIMSTEQGYVSRESVRAAFDGFERVLSVCDFAFVAVPEPESRMTLPRLVRLLEDNEVVTLEMMPDDGCDAPATIFINWRRMRQTKTPEEVYRYFAVGELSETNTRQPTWIVYQTETSQGSDIEPWFPDHLDRWECVEHVYGMKPSAAVVNEHVCANDLPHITWVKVNLDRLVYEV